METMVNKSSESFVEENVVIEQNNKSSAYECKEKRKIYNITDYVINIDSKHDIHVSESMRDGDKESMVDLRLYAMFAIDGNYDGKKKATNRGLHFSFKYLSDVIKSLISIYEIHNGEKFCNE